jgi:DnaJ-class molecular chaperone
MYELWKKDQLGARKALAEESCYTLDVAIRRSCELSKGSTKKRVFIPKKHSASIGIDCDGSYSEIDVPNAVAVIDKNDKQSRVRGWGINGVWFDARDCKRCNNTGQDVNVWGEPCSSCKGASFKPKV